MAKAKPKQNKPVPAGGLRRPVPLEDKRATGATSMRTHLLIAASVAIVTWLFLGVCLQNQLGVWDDVPYIRENRLVKDLSWEGIKNIFTTPCMGNYHPITVLSFAIEYHYTQLEPWLYHFDSLLLHAAVTMLVYWLTWLLSRKTAASAATALLFGLQPMHVESVAWVASRKDLLCALLYFAACIAYVYYRQGSRKWLSYGLVLLFFLLALLSKATAVTLPLALVLIDYWHERRMNIRSLAGKIPHFALALIFGIIAIKAQHTAGAMEMTKTSFAPWERLALGCYALTTYLWKAVLPIHLHCLYPYPFKVNGSIPYSYYGYVALVCGAAFLAWKYLRKNKAVVFGLLFFLVNIVLLLQFLPVGDAVVAERYSYIGYFGLLFIAGFYFAKVFEPAMDRKVRYALLAVSACYIGWLGFLSNQRCSVWQDEMALWRDEAEKEPVSAVRAYNNLGYIYYTKWLGTTNEAEKKVLYDSAAYYMTRAKTLQPDFVNAYLALGELQRNAQKFSEAKSTYFEGLKSNPRDGNLFFGLAIVNYVTKDMDSAGYYFRKVLEVAPTAQAWGNYGNYLTYIGKDDSALAAFDKAVALTKDDYVPYMNRGNLDRKMNRWDEARKDYERALKINPDAGELYYLRSFCDTQSRNNAKAISDIDKAISLGYDKADLGYYNALRSK